MNTSTSVVVFCEEFLRNSKDASRSFAGSEFFSDNILAPSRLNQNYSKMKNEYLVKNSLEMNGSLMLGANLEHEDDIMKAEISSVDCSDLVGDDLKIWERLIAVEHEANFLVEKNVQSIFESIASAEIKMIDLANNREKLEKEIRDKEDLLLGVIVNKLSKKVQKKRKQTQLILLPFCDGLGWRDSKSAFPKSKNILKLSELSVLENNEDPVMFSLICRGRTYDFATANQFNRQTLVNSIRKAQIHYQGMLPGGVITNVLDLNTLRKEINGLNQVLKSNSSLIKKTFFETANYLIKQEKQENSSLRKRLDEILSMKEKTNDENRDLSIRNTELQRDVSVLGRKNMEILQELKNTKFDKILLSNQFDDIELILKKIEGKLRGNQKSRKESEIISEISSIYSESFLNLSMEKKADNQGEKGTLLSRIMDFKLNLNKILNNATVRSEKYNKLKQKVKMSSIKKAVNETEDLTKEVRDNFEALIQNLEDVEDLIVPVSSQKRKGYIEDLSGKKSSEQGSSPFSSFKLNSAIKGKESIFIYQGDLLERVENIKKVLFEKSRRKCDILSSRRASDAGMKSMSNDTKQEPYLDLLQKILILFILVHNHEDQENHCMMLNTQKALERNFRTAIENWHKLTEQYPERNDRLKAQFASALYESWGLITSGDCLLKSRVTLRKYFFENVQDNLNILAPNRESPEEQPYSHQLKSPNSDLINLYPFPPTLTPSTSSQNSKFERKSLFSPHSTLRMRFPSAFVVPENIKENELLDLSKELGSVRGEERDMRNFSCFLNSWFCHKIN